MILITVSVAPLLLSSIESAQEEISNTPSPISSDLIKMLDLTPWIAGAILLITIIIVAIVKYRTTNTYEGEGAYTIEDEENETKRSHRHSTIVFTKNNRREYDIDKYKLGEPSENKLTMKEENFNKSRFD